MKLNRIFFIKWLIAVLFLTACGDNIIFAQYCDGGGCSGYTTQYPSYTITGATSYWATAGTSFYGGEYAVFSVTSGNTYEWSTCNDFGGYQGAEFDAELTLFNSSWSTLCFNDNSGRSDCPFAPYISWTSTYTGNVYVLIKNAYYGACENYTGDVATMVWRQSASTFSCSGWYATPTSSTVVASRTTGNTFNVYVTSGSSCSYYAVTDDSWITTVTYSGSLVTYNVEANSGTARTGTISIRDGSTSDLLATFTVYQSAAASTYVTAEFGYLAGCAGSASYFYDYSTGSPSPDAWSWNFGDGSTSSSSSLSHVYSSAGSYYVTETVYNSAGNSDTHGQTVTVNSPVSAVFGVSSPFAGVSATFSDYSVYNCGYRASWSWDFGDGHSSTLENPSHVYSSPGRYSVSFTACNNLGNCSTASSLITIFSAPVISSISASPGNNIQAGNSITLVPTLSGSPDSYLWTISGGYGSGYTNTTSTDPIPTISFGSPGSYKVTLIAHNGAGWSSLYSTAINFITVQPNTTACVPPGDYVIQEGYNSYSVAEPIDVATGSYGYRHTDLQVAAINTSLKFTRFYNSINDSLNSPLGYGWSHTYNYYVVNQSDSAWSVHYADGHSSVFIPLFQGGGVSFPLFGGTYEKLSKDTATGIFTLAFKTGEKYVFDTGGRLATIEDLNDNVTRLAFTGANLTTIAAPGGRHLTLSYSGSQIATLTDQLSRTIRYGYDAGGNLISATDADLGVTHFSYDSQHRITQITTPLNKILLNNTFDSLGRVVGQSDAFHDSTSIAYNAPGASDATVTYPDGSTVIVHHDTYYRLTHEIDQLGNTKRFTYDSNNNLDSLTDENNLLHAYTYDSVGNLLTVVQPTGIAMQLSYSTFCKPTSIHVPLNRSDSFVYDSHGNILSITLPNSGTLHFGYNGNGQLDSFRDANGNLTTYVYGASTGDLISIHTPAGTKSFTYDSVGRPQTYTDENTHKSTFTYSNNDRLTGVTDPTGHSSIDSFDLDNNHILSLDRNGNITRFSYDGKDRLATILSANGGQKTIAYDSINNIRSVINANGHSIQYGHNPKKWLISMTNSIGTLKLGYDAVGNHVSDTDATGNVTIYVFDSLNRCISIGDPLGNTSRQLYDSLNELVGYQQPSGKTTSYGYNPLGLIASITDAAMHPSSASYDLNGNLRSAIDPNSHTRNLYFDPSNRITSIRDASSNVDSFLYDHVGNPISEIKPTGTIGRTFDSLNRLVRVTNSGGNNYAYTYDANGNVLTTHNNSGTAHFAYDSLNLLKQYVDMYNDTVTYTRDSLGHVKSIRYPGGNVVRYQYNDEEMLSTVTDWQGHVHHLQLRSERQAKFNCQSLQ